MRKDENVSQKHSSSLQQFQYESHAHTQYSGEKRKTGRISAEDGTYVLKIEEICWEREQCASQNAFSSSW